MLICALVSLVINVAAEGIQMITVEDKRAKCLDGSPYVFYIYQVIHRNGASVLEEEVGV